MKHEIKSFGFSISETKEITRDGQKYGYVKGFASTYGNIDRGGDRVMAGAFNECLKEYKASGRPIHFLYQHNPDDIIGKISINDVEDSQKGLMIEAEICLAVQKGAEAYALLKQGAISDFSIGYSIDEYEYEDGVKNLIKLYLWEISVVGEPMNDKANVTDVKSFNENDELPLAAIDTCWSINSAMIRVKKFTDSIDNPSNEFKKAFIFQEKSSQVKFDDYKFLFADVIEGQLKAIPKAIFACAAALNGANGGIELSDIDRKKITGIINSYYQKMDIESPIKKDFVTSKHQLSIEDVENINTKREFEQLLRDSGLFTKKAATFLASQFQPKTKSDSIVQDENDLLTQIKQFKTSLSNIGS